MTPMTQKPTLWLILFALLVLLALYYLTYHYESGAIQSTADSLKPLIDHYSTTTSRTHSTLQKEVTHANQKTTQKTLHPDADADLPLQLQHLVDRSRTRRLEPQEDTP